MRTWTFFFNQWVQWPKRPQQPQLDLTFATRPREHFPLFTSGPEDAVPRLVPTPVSFKDNPGGIIGAAQDPPKKEWELDTNTGGF